MRPVLGKRGLDVMVASAVFICALPCWAVIALLIKLEDGGPVFFRQERIGRHGRRFRIWKFRTMTVQPQGAGPQITIGADRRITAVGRWLRASKLDETPQAINVLRGDMHVVGLRPEVPRYVALYTADQRRLLQRRPGITDPASLRYRHESDLLALAADPEALYRSRFIPDKLKLSANFARRESLGANWRVLLATLVPHRVS